MPNRASSRSTEPASAPAVRLHGDRCHHLPPLTASRMTTSPPFGPGTAPLTSTRLRSVSASTTFRFKRGDLGVAHLAGHLHALEDPGRRGALADRARSAVALVVAVRGALALEVVALHGAGEALALGHGGHVDPLAGLEQVGGELLADRVVADVVEAELDELHAGIDAGLVVVARDRLGQLAGVALAVGDLQCAVAVVLGRLHLHDANRLDAQHRDRDDVVVVVPDLCHADLFADECLFRHGGCLSLEGPGVERCECAAHANAPHRQAARRSGLRLCRMVPTGLSGLRFGA